MQEEPRLDQGTSTTPTPKASGNDPYAVYLDRWRKKAERVDPECWISDYYWPHGVDAGVLLRNAVWEKLFKSAGRRYRSVTLDEFTVTVPRQQAVLDAVRAYLARLDDHMEAGEGLVFYGPLGTGKDHLAISAGRVAIGMGYIVAWRSVQMIFAEFRDSIDGGTGEDVLLAKLLEPDVLILSDPGPMLGDLKEFYAGILYRIVDGRYRECQPTWVTVNAQNGVEAMRQLGPATFDRLSHGATTLFCSWESGRPVGESVR